MRKIKRKFEKNMNDKKILLKGKSIEEIEEDFISKYKINLGEWHKLKKAQKKVKILKNFNKFVKILWVLPAMASSALLFSIIWAGLGTEDIVLPLFIKDPVHFYQTFINMFIGILYIVFTISVLIFSINKIFKW